MAEAEEEMSGTEKAALLLMTLGEDEASEILKFMGADEVQAVGEAMANLKAVSKNDANWMLDSFITEVEDQTSLGVNTESKMRKLLGNALGESKANAFVDRMMTGRSSHGLDSLRWMSAREVADIIQDEHPQIVAIVLAYLDPTIAAEVVQMLPHDLQTDMIIRVANLSDVQQSALAEIEALIAAKSSSTSGGETFKVGGDKCAADIVNAIQNERGDTIMDEIKERDADLGERIEDMMFVFETLLSVDDKGIQSLLREISNDLLVVALKGCDPAVGEKILSNMSKRAATLLKEDMEAKGPIKLSDVETAQKEILEVARRLAESGEINLGLDGEVYV
ncbi:MAG: flagellar motor switch protein FliG [Woeseiaceae bacterium]|nr:flagellar motor switch protein FliG [Woeseiaceae bacterium]